MIRSLEQWVEWELAVASRVLRGSLHSLSLSPSHISYHLTWGQTRATVAGSWCLLQLWHCLCWQAFGTIIACVFLVKLPSCNQTEELYMYCPPPPMTSMSGTCILHQERTLGCQVPVPHMIPTYGTSILYKKCELKLSFELLTAVTMKNAVFWDVMPCGSCKNRFLSHRWWRRYVPLKRATRHNIREDGILLWN
jgi:hypothetical protein